MIWGFPKMGVSQKCMVYKGKSIYKWMMTGGTPILGNLHVGMFMLITFDTG